MPLIQTNEILRPLRQALASIEPSSGFPLGAEEAALPLGLPAVDALLAGGIALRALHEVVSGAAAHLGATFGFALAIAAQAVRHATRLQNLHTPFGSRPTTRRSKAASPMGQASICSGCPWIGC